MQLPQKLAVKSAPQLPLAEFCKGAKTLATGSVQTAKLSIYLSDERWKLDGYSGNPLVSERRLTPLQSTVA